MDGMESWSALLASFNNETDRRADATGAFSDDNNNMGWPSFTSSAFENAAMLNAAMMNASMNNASTASSPVSFARMSSSPVNCSRMASAALVPSAPIPSLMDSAAMGRAIVGRNQSSGASTSPSLSMSPPALLMPPPVTSAMVAAAAAASPRSSRPVHKGRECKFCKNNGETIQQYTSHVLRSPNGVLICPVLRSHVCEICGKTGDDAHTRNYCPERKERQRRALPLALKSTRRQSDGNIRPQMNRN